MSEKTLGIPFDIHSGGMDLTFPHHENEIAQSCSAHNKKDEPRAFAKYWVHNGFVIVDGVGSMIGYRIGFAGLLELKLLDWYNNIHPLKILLYFL